MPKSKRKSPRQQPPAKSQSQRPSPQLPKKEPRKPRKGTLPMSAFERKIFLGMQSENQRLEAAQRQLEMQWKELLNQHNENVKALGETHGLDFLFKVSLNKEGTALNWEEVIVDKTEGQPGGPGPTAAAASG